MGREGRGVTIRISYRRSARSSLLAVVALPVVMTGCASIGLSEPTLSDRPVRTYDQEVALDTGVLVALKQTGTQVDIKASKVCDLHEHTVVSRTATHEREIENPAVDWVLAGGGLALAGVGAGFLVDAESVHPTDPTSREYNPTGPDVTRGVGVGFIVAGVGLGTIAIVDAIRASGEEQKVSQVELSPKVTKKRIACSEAFAEGAEVSGVFLAFEGVALGSPEQQSVTFGTTDTTGELSFDIDTLIADELTLPGDRLEMVVAIADKQVGKIDLAPLRKKRLKRSWTNAKIESCRKPQSAKACDGVRRHLHRYPDSPYASEADDALIAAEPTLAILRDDEDWAVAKDAIPACTTEPANSAGEVMLACEPLETYLAKHPEGRHVEDAKKALKQGQLRGQEIAVNAAVKRNEAEKEAERIQKAEAAKQAAEERKKKAAERQRCVGQCQVFCSGRRRNVQMCLQGCIQSECE